MLLQLALAALPATQPQQTVCFTPHGEDAIAVTVTLSAGADSSLALATNYPSALLADPYPCVSGDKSLVNGNLHAKMDGDLLVFSRVSDGAELLRESTPRTFNAWRQERDGNVGRLQRRWPQDDDAGATSAAHFQSFCGHFVACSVILWLLGA